MKFKLTMVPSSSFTPTRAVLHTDISRTTHDNDSKQLTGSSPELRLATRPHISGGRAATRKVASSWAPCAPPEERCAMATNRTW
eukprot:CAMPEP_0181363656 /NCGR_PEP_ID=MMETSP1106-20121128/8878_1 /TAXON_ID=81844 /ORGANISM="Mantoniella antarctica, Strain SL-175" /LENGTH=83 /DNA_ID=CAMNT_0023478135 /DNA_START=818 /DNA_END=1069 /DNA_ORIENTATION=-